MIMESRYNKVIDKELLASIPNNSVDLVLTDPPYIISKGSGMQFHRDRKPGDKGYEQISKKLVAEFTVPATGDVAEYVMKDPIELPNGKSIGNTITHTYLGTNYTATIKEVEINYGRRFATATDYGQWDKDYTIDDLDKSIKEFYRILKPGGSCIIFFDIWKIETLTNLLSKFSKHRFIEWVKTNPVPINSKATYLSNAREIAISCVKGGKATFNSKYDNGIYKYPIYGGKDRFHPTQKSLPLFEELIKKHSNEGDVVVDPYGGSATTAIACINTNRIYISGEPSEEYFQKGYNRCQQNILSF